MTAREQRLIALDRANETRLARAELKRSLRDGTLSFRQALDAPVAGGMVVWALLKAKRGIGPDRVLGVSSALARRRVRINFHTRIEKLTERQKLALLDVVESRDAPRVKSPRPVKLKPAPHPTRPDLAAAREAAQVDVENPPPRCTGCKAQLLAESASGLCTFCEIETAEAA